MIHVLNLIHAILRSNIGAFFGGYLIGCLLTAMYLLGQKRED